MTEDAFLTALRTLPLAAGARGLTDDAATLRGLVLTKDLLVEGVHFRRSDSPADVAWKLVATNLSDLAAKAAVPQGVLLGYPIRDGDWDGAFLSGLNEALTAFDCPLLGGDTVRLPTGAPRILSLTAIGARTRPPRRDGAQVGDTLWVTGTIGDAGAGLAGTDDAYLASRYLRPVPRLAEGRALGPYVTAMMDVSDGLLLDASRMAAASGVAVSIDLAAVPLSRALVAHAGDTREARIAAATAGDDYELLFALPPDTDPPVAATRIGTFAQGTGLTLRDRGDPIMLPRSLGFEHSADQA